MQKDMQFQTLVDERLIAAVPDMLPLLGHRVRLTALDVSESTPPRVPGKPKGTLFHAFERAGLIGCIEDGPGLSADYKQHP